MTDSQAAQVAAYWVQFRHDRFERPRDDESALIAKWRRVLAERVSSADAWALVPGGDAEELAVLADGHLYRLSATNYDVSVRTDDVNAETCRVEVAETAAERVRRWTLHLPGDVQQLEVDIPRDAKLFGPTQLFARTLAQQLGHDVGGLQR